MPKMSKLEVIGRALTDEHKLRFVRDGFVVLESLISASSAALLNERFERVLRAEYDTGVPPDKRPKAVKEANQGVLGFSGNIPPKGSKTLQVINVWKCDSAFRDFVTSPVLGALVADLAGWPGGARVAQDQVWAKPPGAPPLVFHRDSPYFDFEPADVVTVWLALDRMDQELGPLEYVKGSHLWGDARTGSASVFFDEDRTALMHSAAAAEGIGAHELEIASLEGLEAGSVGIHNGRTWHGSGPNASKTRPRRGLGVHFVPADVRFKSGELGPLWKKLQIGDTLVASDESFPVTCDRRSVLLPSS
jgi:ectoine hydroxylase-related dioxygenase (phytanoyl-CoA dioxygenase family)